MANDNNIKEFTALDIEKYHKGLLSPKEMHDMEKAALDDPFLADALEGYAVTGVNVSADIADLKSRLAERTEKAKVIPLNAGGRSGIPWLRAAAMFIILAGAGLLSYLFIFKKEDTEIAKVEQVKTEQQKDTGSSSIKNDLVTDSNTSTATVATGKGTAATADTKNKITTGSNASETINAEVATPAGATDIVRQDIADASKNLSVEEKEVKSDIATTKKKEISPSTPVAAMKDAASGTIPAESNDGKTRRAVTSVKKPDDLYKNSHIFRGRVTDASNVGVPFANVTNVEDNVGTYTDAKGYFNLTSPDTVLNVQVRSIGFESNNLQLRNNVPSNQVVMQDDRRSLSEMVISNQKPNAAPRAQNNNVKLEEPEPADGWDNYDAYLANNLNVPDDFTTKQNSTAAVQVSFEVDKNGEPINIRVEKSLCDKCDKEAIRLIKEGPKWKRNARKGRTTVTIPFNQLFR
ncbi:MAG: carboxypeptidase-like regulatory domain-containing protein [Chitinophagaceae bacterium]|nr:carboxypeptidase-like regulatory domain-containing protein [Chitinophagaceae bacterium]